MYEVIAYLAVNLPTTPSWHSDIGSSMQQIMKRGQANIICPLLLTFIKKILFHNFHSMNYR